MKPLYPHKISLDTKPVAGKKYSFTFSWRATEDLSQRNIIDALDVIIEHFRAKYEVQQLEIHGLEPLRTTLTISFIFREDSALSLRQIWEETTTFAFGRYLILTLEEAVIWKAAFPYWVLLIVGGGVGAITGTARRK